MELISGLHMNSSVHGVNSYANNSIVQRRVIMKTKPLIEKIMKTMQLSKSFPEKCFVMADMGCSVGPNTFLPLSLTIDAMAGLCQSPPQLQVYLNDLPGNDFNSIFRSLPDLYDSLSKQGVVSPSCYISGTAGSFYGRLFPASSLHFVYSSSSLHYLSQVPEGVEDNKRHIHVAKTSPPKVFEAYSKQFERDFSKFLGHRAEEVKPRGSMILVLLSKSPDDPSAEDGGIFWELLSKSLLDMVAEGRIEEGDVESFNVPFYSPSKEEVKKIIERQGSFNIERLDSIEENYDYDEKVANYVRAVAESMLTSHFGSEVIEDLFDRYVKVVRDHLYMEKTKHLFLAISMTKNNQTFFYDNRTFSPVNAI